MTDLYNFCDKWREFTKLEIDTKIHYDFKSLLNTEVNIWKWMKWGAELVDKQALFFMGIPVIEGDGDKDSLNKKKEINFRCKQKVEQLQMNWEIDMDRYSWLICKDLINFSANLQCTHWKRLYWFYWLFSWLKANKDTCPNCRNKFDCKNIITNLSIEDDLNMMLSIWNKKNKFDWREHHKNCDLYCKTWCQEIWHIWVLKKKHELHILGSLEDQIEFTLNSAKQFTDPIKSIKNIKIDEF